MTAPLRDARGCLTEGGLVALERAPVGRAPADLVAHVASCARCQDRMLHRSAGAEGRRGKAEPPPPWRIWVVLGAALLMLLSALMAARWLGGRP